MFVNGDVTLQSGELNLMNQHIHVKSIQSTSATENLIDPLFRGHASNMRYSGNVLDLSIQKHYPDNDLNYAKKANFMQFRKENNDIAVMENNQSDSELIFQIDESGNIQSAGGAIFSGISGLKVIGGTVLQGGLALKREVITPVLALTNEAGNKEEYSAIVPSETTYAVIANLNPTAKHLNLQLLTSTDTTTSSRSNSDDINIGRLVIISNQCDLVTSGDAAIPPKSTVMLLYDGRAWINIEALKAPMQVLFLYMFLLHPYSLINLSID